MKRTIQGKLDRGPREFETRVHEHEGEVMGIARRNVITVPPTISIKGAAETMASYKTRRLPITHPGTGKIEGIIISRDIINFLGGGEKNRIISEKYYGNLFAAINDSIRDIMSRDVITVKNSASIDEVVREMKEKNVGGFPVVNAEYQVVGIIEEKDLVRQIAGTITGELVGDRMTTNPIAITPGTTIRDTNRFMIANDIRRLPVVSEGELVGLITTTDILRYFASNEMFRQMKGDPLSLRIREVMVSDMKTISPREDVGKAVQVMKDSDVGCLLVMDGGLVGMLTERDILGLF
ncbi:MAG: CBS domain-containing protein [Theionarchaea archaeon]|nr:CBS domain-containing protein [Theionarchaea archaeon]MBU7037592.1 CBS domain-containing protein [Theionarchaea archaeon]